MVASRGSKLTWQSAVVGDEAGHVYVLVVDTQVLHAAHKLTVANRKILREFRDPSEEQGAGQVQGSEKMKQVYTPRVCYSVFTTSTLIGGTQSSVLQCYFSPWR